MTRHLGDLNLSAGDTDLDEVNLDSASIICTTPEKFDSVTRRLNEGGGVTFFGDISLVLIDEVSG